MSGNTTATVRNQRVSRVALWRLVHALNHRRPADAAALLTQSPDEVAARALADAREGMQISRLLGPRRLDALIALLPPNSPARCRLRAFRILGAQPDHPKSAIDELQERLDRNPDEVRSWYRH